MAMVNQHRLALMRKVSNRRTKPFRFDLGNRGLFPHEVAIVERTIQAFAASAACHGRSDFTDRLLSSLGRKTMNQVTITEAVALRRPDTSTPAPAARLLRVEADPQVLHATPQEASPPSPAPIA